MMEQTDFRYRIRTDATPDERYIVKVEMRLLQWWVTIKSYTTCVNPSDEDMDYARLCADELIDKLRQDETI